MLSSSGASVWYQPHLCPSFLFLHITHILTLLWWHCTVGSYESVAFEWYTCYIIEETLSLDNLFAFYLVFKYFKVPVESQNRVLQWGIIGAVVMRALMIGAG